MRRILVIDPANVFIHYVELVVRRYGYVTRGVGSAREALEALARERVDLVISQEKLPDMAWSDFCRRVETDSERSGVPVVILAPDPASFDDRGCKGITVAGVRTRPISMRDLIKVIQENLPYKNKRRQVRAVLAVKALIREGDAFVPCHVLNLSEGGVFVMRRNPLPLGTEVHLRLTFQEMETPLQVSGKVVSVAEKTRRRHPGGIGIEFDELDTGTREKLHRYVKGHLATILGR